MLLDANRPRAALWTAAFLHIALLTLLAVPAGAQGVRIEPVRPVPIAPPPVALPPAVTAPGLGGVLQTLPDAPTLTPQQLPSAAAPAAAPAARAAPTQVVRFRCKLPLQAQTCRKPASSDGDDGGGGDEECNCAHDHCYWDDRRQRVCEKLQ